MNILLLGSGGREHALALKMRESSLLSKLYIAPGNAGTISVGTNLDIDINNFNIIKENKRGYGVCFLQSDPYKYI